MKIVTDEEDGMNSDKFNLILYAEMELEDVVSLSSATSEDQVYLMVTQKHTAVTVYQWTGE